MEPRYMCLKCGRPTATRQRDICGWDGSCSRCGAIAQSQVGDIEVEPRALPKMAMLRFHYVESVIDRQERWLYVARAAPRLRYFLRDTSGRSVAELFKEHDQIMELIEGRLKVLAHRRAYVEQLKRDAAYWWACSK